MAARTRLPGISEDYNARLYDPSLGRFLSVDPLIGHPESTQGINPYSYVENNPLNKTDPTGETTDSGGTGGCTGGGDNQVCSVSDIPTKNVQSLSVNTDGSVTVTLTNGATMSSSAGAISADTVAGMALGAVQQFGTSSVNFGNLSKMITGLDPKDASTHTNISPSRVRKDKRGRYPFYDIFGRCHVLLEQSSAGCRTM